VRVARPNRWMLVVVAALAVCRTAGGADIKGECVDAHERAQSLRHAGKLRDARASLVFCARPICPAAIQKECGPWLEQVTAEQPSIVLAIRDSAGADVLPARVLIDGEVVPDAALGRAIELDPGQHALRIELGGTTPPIEQRLAIRDGERRRPVTIGLPPASDHPATVLAQAGSGSDGRRNAAIGLATAGAAALAAAIGLTIAQNSEASTLRSLCPTSCVLGSANANQASTARSTAETERALEGASYGVAGVALVVATYLFLTPRAPSASAFAASLSPQAAAVRWTLEF
jgi:hypothetical protein